MKLATALVMRRNVFAEDEELTAAIGATAHRIFAFFTKALICLLTSCGGPAKATGLGLEPLSGSFEKWGEGKEKPPSAIKALSCHAPHHHRTGRTPMRLPGYLFPARHQVRNDQHCLPLPFTDFDGEAEIAVLLTLSS